jgi:hypothetical protein
MNKYNIIHKKKQCSELNVLFKAEYLVLFINIDNFFIISYFDSASKLIVLKQLIFNF